MFRKKTDPLSDRARALNGEIAALEEEIKRLDSVLQQTPQSRNAPRLRSTAVPHGAAPHHVPEFTPSAAGPARPLGGEDGKNPFSARTAPQEPIFEDVDHGRLEPAGDDTSSPNHFNELGVRKYDLPALLQRIRHHFRGPSTTNPKLVNYLAAGGIQGLRPLRYEKRVARNRFIALVVVLFGILLGILLAFASHH